MEKILPILMDLCVITFDLLVFTHMISLKNNSLARRILMYAGCGVIVLAYFIATYVLAFPAALSSALCMSVPSLVLFFILSRFKDARFFLTFCFVDSCTLIFAFLGRFLGIVTGEWGNVIALCVMLAVLLAVFFVGRPYFRQYAKLLEYVKDGWIAMTVCSFLIYFALIIFAAYPSPLIERPDYWAVYLLFSAVVLSCYSVFISSALKTSRIYEQSQQLLREQKWHRIACMDALTGTASRTAYVEKMSQIERSPSASGPVCLAVFDLDRFKEINDTWGHTAGDGVLKNAAEMLLEVFSEPEYSVFRIGGDEFVVIGEGVAEQAVREKLLEIERMDKENRCKIPYSISAGYDFLLPEEEDAVERAFSRADKKMYEQKMKKEGQAK